MRGAAVRARSRPEPNRYHPKPRDTCNVKVALRCRPLSDAEKSDPHAFTVVACRPDDKEVVVTQTVPGRRVKDAQEKTYTFDHVLVGSQQLVFERVARPVLDEVLGGYNGTVFAYGQTGTGKTHTITGDLTGVGEGADLGENAGIVPRCVDAIFRALADKSEHSVRVSFLEIYNEELVDLLDDTVGGRAPLRIFEDAKHGTAVQDLTEVPVHDAPSAFQVLARAAARRRTAETLMNRASSRSHCICTFVVHCEEQVEACGEDAIRLGKLHLVDLAGSESVARSGSVKQQAKEAGMINQSLVALGRVITALVDHTGHVPYRDSKLTRLLQDSLGGHMKTSIIATISPSSANLEETLSTLDYAHRAKNIRNKPQVNQKVSPQALLKEMSGKLGGLQAQLTAQWAKDAVYLPEHQHQALIAQSEQLASSLETQTAELASCTQGLQAREREVEQVAKDLAQAKALLAQLAQTLARELLRASKADEERAALEQQRAQMHQAAQRVRASEERLVSAVQQLELDRVQSTAQCTRLASSVERLEEAHGAVLQAVGALQVKWPALSRKGQELAESAERQHQHWRAQSSVVEQGWREQLAEDEAQLETCCNAMEGREDERSASFARLPRLGEELGKEAEQAPKLDAGADGDQALRDLEDQVVQELLRRERERRALRQAHEAREQRAAQEPVPAQVACPPAPPAPRCADVEDPVPGFAAATRACVEEVEGALQELSQLGHPGELDQRFRQACASLEATCAASVARHEEKARDLDALFAELHILDVKQQARAEAHGGQMRGLDAAHVEQWDRASEAHGRALEAGRSACSACAAKGGPAQDAAASRAAEELAAALRQADQDWREQGAAPLAAARRELAERGQKQALEQQRQVQELCRGVAEQACAQWAPLVAAQRVALSELEPLPLQLQKGLAKVAKQQVARPEPYMPSPVQLSRDEATPRRKKRRRKPRSSSCRKGKVRCELERAAAPLR